MVEEDARPLVQEGNENSVKPSVESVAERRQVTILFADLSGFTQLTETISQEELHGLMLRFFTEVDTVLTSYGGSIDKHIGDAVMALFGAPVTHGNDNERAINAAINLHVCMEKLSSELGHKLRVHIGIASGLVVASGADSGAHQEYTVLGDSVNLASRLVDHAKPGETLISDEAKRDALEIFELADMGSITVKGISSPVKAWKVLGLATEDNRREVSPLFGRQRETRQFESILDTSQDTEAGQTVYIRGEPGIGKTRLVKEFVNQATLKGFICHSTIVLDFGTGKQRDGTSSLIDSLVHVDPDQSQRDQELIVKETVAQELLDSDQSIFLKNLLDIPLSGSEKIDFHAMDNQHRTRGRQDVILTLLKRMSKQQPVLLLIEDLHWADPPTLELILRISELCAYTKLLLVITSRPEGGELKNFWNQLVDHASLATMNLAPLSERVAMEFAGHYLEANNDFAIECIKRAEGNPLFLEQLLRNAESMGKDQVPGSIRSIVLSRVDRLDYEDRRGLLAASVLGQRFSIGDVRYLIEDESWQADALEALQLIRSTADGYLFAHAMIWESVYSTLLKDQLSKLHRRAARRLGDNDLILKAEHLARAESPGAAAAFLAAATDQFRLYRYESARSLAENGLALVKDRGEQHGLQMCLGECLRELGELEESINTFEKALEAANTDIARCRAWIGLAAAIRVTDRLNQALEILEKAETTATGDPRLVSEMSQIHYHRGNIYFPMGNITGCLEEHEKALDLAQKADDKNNEARAMSGMGDAFYSSGRMKLALDYFQKCVDLSEQHGFGRIVVSNQSMVAWTLLYMCQMERSLDMAKHAVESAERAGQHRSEMVARLTAARSLLENGQYSEAQVNIEQGLKIVESLKADRFKAFFLIFQARLPNFGGLSKSETIKALNTAIEQCRESGHGFIGPWLLGTMAIISDDPSDSRKALQEGESFLNSGCVGHNYFGFYEDAMSVSLSIGDLSEAERYAAALEAYMHDEPLSLYEFRISLTRILIEHYKNPRDKAVNSSLHEFHSKALDFGLNRTAATTLAVLPG